MTAVETDELFWHKFWKNFPTAADYFSPAVVALQDYLGFRTKDILRSLGEGFGRKAAEKFGGWELKDVIAELSGVWERMQIGRLEVVARDPLTLMISDCMICGQVAGTGGMYECAFHEGFFHGVISGSAGRDVELRQDSNFEGPAGTWCRRFVANVAV